MENPQQVATVVELAAAVAGWAGAVADLVAAVEKWVGAVAELKEAAAKAEVRTAALD